MMKAALVMSTMLVLHAILDRTSGANELSRDFARGLRTLHRSGKQSVNSVLQHNFPIPLQSACPIDHCLQLLTSSKKTHQRQRRDASSSDVDSATDSSIEFDETTPRNVDGGASDLRNVILARVCIDRQRKKCEAAKEVELQSEGDRQAERVAQRKKAGIRVDHCSAICRSALRSAIGGHRAECRRCLDEVEGPSTSNAGPDRGESSSVDEYDQFPASEFQITRGSRPRLNGNPSTEAACRAACSLVASASDAIECIQRECYQFPIGGQLQHDAGLQDDGKSTDVEGSDDESVDASMAAASAKRWGNRVGRRSWGTVSRINDDDADRVLAVSSSRSAGGGEQPMVISGGRSMTKRWAERICIMAHCRSYQHSRVNFAMCGQEKCREGRRRR